MNSEIRKNTRRLDLIRGALVLTLILYIVVALIINSSYLTADRLMRLRSNVIHAISNSGEKISLDSEDTVSVELFQDGYAVLTRNGIKICSGEGYIYSSHVLQYKQPCMKVCGKYILCFDRGGTSWSLLNSFRVLCSGKESGDIINGAVSDDGYFSIAAEKTEYKGCVTVYNTKGTSLARWNSDTYLIDSFFTSKNRLTVVSVASDREKTHTIFTVFNYRKAEAEASVSAPNTFPLALGLKENGAVEMLTSSGAILFDGDTAAVTHTYPEPSPGAYRQGESSTMISYQTLSGAVLVEAFSAKGETLFSLEYPSVLSLGCVGDYYFVLTQTHLFILDSSGGEVESREVSSASELLVSPEISVLLTSDAVIKLDLSSLP